MNKNCPIIHDLRRVKEVVKTQVGSRSEVKVFIDTATGSIPQRATTIKRRWPQKVNLSCIRGYVVVAQVQRHGIHIYIECTWLALGSPPFLQMLSRQSFLSAVGTVRARNERVEVGANLYLVVTYSFGFRGQSS